MAGKAILSALKSPWAVLLSAAGGGYFIYSNIETYRAGTKYDFKTDLTGKTYIVTGATSGLGKALTEKLADKGARVIMATRNREKCQAVRRDIVLSTRNKLVFCRQCDMADLDSIEQFVSKLYKGKFAVDHIDGFVHNAGTMEPKRQLTKDGLEKTLATNYLGPFLLTGLLLQKLLNQEKKSRVVFVNTNIATTDKVKLNLDNLNSELEVDAASGKAKEKWDGFEVYKSSKQAELLFARELAERLKDSNVTVITADPGRSKTKLASRMDWETFFLSRWACRVYGFFLGRRRPQEAIKPLLYAVADEEAESKSGIFLNHERKEEPWGARSENVPLRQRLWAISEKWTHFDENLAKLKGEIGAETYEHGTEQEQRGSRGKAESGILQRWLPFWS